MRRLGTHSSARGYSFILASAIALPEYPISTIALIGLKLSQEEDLKQAALMTQVILAQAACKINPI